MLQAILLGLISMLGNAEYLFGTSCLSRPLVMGCLLYTSHKNINIIMDCFYYNGVENTHRNH